MPFSNRKGKGFIKKWLGKKYPILKHANWTGVEAWKPYIDQYNLTTRYNNIVNADIRTIDYSKFEKFDLAFAGDVLEHMTKEEAVTLVENILAISSILIISIPIIHYPQEEYEGNPFEAHVKDDWSHTEVIKTFPNIECFFEGNMIGIYVLSRKT